MYMKSARPRTALALLAPLLLSCCQSVAAVPTAPAEPAAAPPEAPPAAAIAPPAVAYSASAYACAASLAPDQSAAVELVRSSYRAWKSAYVTREGAGGHLRVRVKGYDYGTPSEGVGYGMLLAAYLDDRETFDGLWAYARGHLNENGLMPWKIDANNRVVDDEAATDGDEDIAFALVVADARWGGYRADATRLIADLYEHAVEPGTFVFKPGAAWGGSRLTNPSYFAPAYYKVFADYTGNEGWNRVADVSYEILDRVAARRSPATGLQPGWTTAAGDPVKDFDFSYEYNATRVPWRLAKDAAWNCDPRARAHLDRINSFFRSVGAKNIRDGYTLDGKSTGRWHNASFVAPPTAGALLSEDEEYRLSMWRETVELGHVNYYDDSLRLLALLLASGQMPHPFQGLVESFESARPAGWTSYAAGGGTISPKRVPEGSIGSRGALRVDFRLPADPAALAGVQLAFWGESQDWSGTRGLELQLHGSGSGSRIRVVLADNGSDGTWKTAETYTFVLTDDVAGWRTVTIPWDRFIRGSRQPSGAPEDGLTLREVWGLGFEPVAGSGGFGLDQIRLLR
jgi:endo-1,4-beta-D-glucanase Y